MTTKADIAVWSDYVCPFCYLQEPVLARLRDEYGERINLQWRAFELRPEPYPTLDPDGEYLLRVWRQSVYPMARERDMTLQLPPVQPRSRTAFELAEFARDVQRHSEVHRALFKAFFEDGRDIGDLDTLVAVAAEIGLPAAAARDALLRGQFRSRVLADERQARALNISGVPTALSRDRARPSKMASSYRERNRINT